MNRFQLALLTTAVACGCHARRATELTNYVDPRVTFTATSLDAVFPCIVRSRERVVALDSVSPCAAMGMDWEWYFHAFSGDSSAISRELDVRRRLPQSFSVGFPWGPPELPLTTADEINRAVTMHGWVQDGHGQMQTSTERPKLEVLPNGQLHLSEHQFTELTRLFNLHPRRVSVAMRLNGRLYYHGTVAVRY